MFIAPLRAASYETAVVMLIIYDPIPPVVLRVKFVSLPNAQQNRASRAPPFAKHKNHLRFYDNGSILVRIIKYIWMQLLAE